MRLGMTCALLLLTPILFGKLTPTWSEIDNMVASMCDEIPKEEVDVLMGISVGGLVPTVFFSNHLQNKNVVSIAASSYNAHGAQGELKVWNLPSQELLAGKNVLLIDDIADSGKTIHKIRELLLDTYGVKSLRVATLYVNAKNCQYFPDYYAKFTDQWIQFPWETD